MWPRAAVPSLAVLLTAARGEPCRSNDDCPTDPRDFCYGRAGKPPGSPGICYGCAQIRGDCDALSGVDQKSCLARCPRARAAAVKAPLRTNGSAVVDAAGAAVRLACVNWYGAHMTRYVVNGLDKQSVQDIANRVAAMGFNCVRLVFSNDLYYKNPAVAASAVSANPSLAGKPAMEVFDATVSALTSAGVMVILNNHISEAGWCCNTNDGNGLWYTSQYPTSKWQDMWVGLAQRYAANPLVVGADLRNELREAGGVSPTWGTGGAKTDWKKAAEDCGNAVLQANSKLLILVEGLNYANDLRGVRSDPVQLNVPNQLVYSGHVYSWDGQFSTNSYDKFEKSVDEYETFVTAPDQPYTAPFWLGEFGTNTADKCWKDTIQLLKNNPTFGWAYWALDGYKGDGKNGGDGSDETFGIFEDDYKTIRHAWKLSDLQTVQ